MVNSQNRISDIHSELQFFTYMGILDINVQRYLHMMRVDKWSGIFVLAGIKIPNCSSMEVCNLIDARGYVHHYNPLITQFDFSS